jgi:hypothetical protein
MYNYFGGYLFERIGITFNFSDTSIKFPNPLLTFEIHVYKCKENRLELIKTKSLHGIRNNVSGYSTKSN